MADYTAKKEQFASQMITTADTALTLAEDLEALDAAYSVNAFNTGAANAYVDADFDASNRHLTATAVADIMYAIGILKGAFTAGIKDALRKALMGGLP